ncbi:hypothetical protein BB560_001271 [Smittium megazygosporum]|uniref:Uncharacterized protein n=1 Tax=Smittium megazygosporum TaxID=133381 RepID=A0A2T9ZI31_9FUNG|nr:hypothetical protein BB560_001271 [Smittium megazygosporum]
MFERLAGKTTLITGASAGFGWFTALTFAKFGSNLILVARREEKLQELKKKINALYPAVDVDIYKLDVSKHSEIKQVFSDILEKTPHIDILINNAGLAHGGDPVSTVTEESMDIMFDTNVKGLVWVTQQVLPGMLERNTGHIINVGSIAGIQSTVLGSVYSATKHAVHALTESLRIETVATNVKVSEICPGLAETEFAIVRFNGDKDLASKMYKGMEPLTGEDIAEIIAFTASTHPRCVISQSVIVPSCQANTFITHRRG